MPYLACRILSPRDSGMECSPTDTGTLLMREKLFAVLGGMKSDCGGLGPESSKKARCGIFATPPSREQGELLQPGGLTQSGHEIEVLDRLAGRALDQVVERRKHDHPAGQSVGMGR
jgi:hypothetical protein